MLANSMSVNTSNVKKNPFNAKPAAKNFKINDKINFGTIFGGCF